MSLLIPKSPILCIQSYILLTWIPRWSNTSSTHVYLIYASVSTLPHLIESKNLSRDININSDYLRLDYSGLSVWQRVWLLSTDVSLPFPGPPLYNIMRLATDLAAVAWDSPSLFNMVSQLFQQGYIEQENYTWKGFLELHPLNLFLSWSTLYTYTSEKYWRMWVNPKPTLHEVNENLLRQHVWEIFQIWTTTRFSHILHT